MIFKRCHQDNHQPFVGLFSTCSIWNQKLVVKSIINILRIWQLIARLMAMLLCSVDELVYNDVLTQSNPTLGSQTACFMALNFQQFPVPVFQRDKTSGSFLDNQFPISFKCLKAFPAAVSTSNTMSYPDFQSQLSTHQFQALSSAIHHFQPLSQAVSKSVSSRQVPYSYTEVPSFKFP